MKILYLHGLEEHRLSIKPVLLKSQEDFDVEFPELDVAPWKKNGFIVQALKSKRIWANICLTGIGIYIGLPSIANLIGLGVALFLQKERLKCEIVKGTLEETYEIAIRALEQSKPDIVVGFSWGGALATMLLKTGRWKGPTLLLAPAYEKLLSICDVENIGEAVVLTDRIRYRENMDPSLKDCVKIVVGTREQIISLDLLKSFASKNEFELILVPNAVHKLWKFTELPDVIRSFL